MSGTHKIQIAGMIPVVYFREGESVVAYSPALDLASYGDTTEKARKNFKEATDLFIEGCLKKGTLAEVLTACGWTPRMVKNKRCFEPPEYLGEEQVAVEQFA